MSRVVVCDACGKSVAPGDPRFTFAVMVYEITNTEKHTSGSCLHDQRGLDACSLHCTVKLMMAATDEYKQKVWKTVKP
jgi:hypothetical protein